MPFGQYNLARIQTLQPSLRPLATRLIELATEQGIDLEVVQAFRSPQQQQALFSSGQNVTNAPALMSYHQYGLAFDVVPSAYLQLPNWNPTGPLWPQLGALGESIGLEWGGRWSHPDRPHFQIPEQAAPIQELKTYWQRALAAGKSGLDLIMPVSISPSVLGGGIIVVLALVVGLWLVPELRRRGVV
jgi:peptidoglycan L-alanyl-D-glutamate endopeptidase CwlK